MASVVENLNKAKDATVSGASKTLGYAGNIVKKSLKGDSQQAAFAMAEIGKPFEFPDMVDQNRRTYQFLLSRMQIVDLYPCNYGQSFLYNSEAKKTRFKYGVAYQNAMKRYGKMCFQYLGGMPYGALRVFLTDDSAVTDGLSTQFQPNFFQAMADKLSNMTQAFTNLGASMTSSGMQIGIDQILSDIDADKIAGSATEGINSMLGTNLGAGFQDAMGNVIDMMKQGANIILKGNKLTLPKIWQNSSYHPVFSVSTKLFSPYGSPKAIKEYIIKPLTLLMLMAVPQSDDLVSYGRPFAVTVRFWGSSFLTLAGITNISIQRGGGDSVQNIYKQPLIVNVNIEFTSLTDGMLAYVTDRTDLGDPPIYEVSSYDTSDQILTLNGASGTIDGSLLPTVVPTLGGFIRSFQPVQIDGVNSGMTGPGGVRQETMIGGNGSGGGFGLGDLLGMAEGFMAPFNAALQYASNSAMEEGVFGAQLLNGVTNFVSGAAAGASMITGALNNTVGQLGAIANTVTLGAFGQTKLAKDVVRVQNQVNRNVMLLNQGAGAIRTINTAVQNTTTSVGSLLDIPLGTR